MSHTPDAIFHITTPDEWTEARAAGEYRRSTRGKSLDEVGFIHCSFAGQLTQTANRFYADVTELLVLEIDPELLDVEVKVESDPTTTQEFPHIYGPIATSAVLDEVYWDQGDDGVWHRPPVAD